MAFSEKISVIMPTYNTPISILQEAVESILDQSFGDFEFIIIDDCSTNGSKAYLDNINDKRVRVVRNSTNMGITKSLNVGLKMASGKYIARMDSDDIALPSRFEKQYSFMESHEDVIVCGTNVEFFGANSGYSRSRVDNMDNYRAKLLFMNPGPYHPTVFIRNEVIKRKSILYDENLMYAQDYGLWAAISHIGNVYILEEVLLRYRKHVGQASIKQREAQIQCDKMIKKKLLIELLGSVTDGEVDMHFKYSSPHCQGVVINPEIVRWYKRLINANKKRGLYNQGELKKCIEMIQIRLIEQSFRKEMSKLEKTMLIFHNLPFPYAVKTTIEIAKIKYGIK